MDVPHAETVEGGLDALIERCHAQRVRDEGEREEEALWMASVRLYEDRRHRQRLWEKLRFHEGQLRRHTATYEHLHRYHRAEVLRCEAALGIGDPGEGVS